MLYYIWMGSVLGDGGWGGVGSGGVVMAAAARYFGLQFEKLGWEGEGGGGWEVGRVAGGRT